MLVSASYLAINLKNLFISCINVDIDKMLLSEETKDQGNNIFTVISLCNS